MNLCQFLHFGDKCPICDEPLKLYMQVIDGPLWKATPSEHDEFIFEIIRGDHKNEDDCFITLVDKNDNVEILFNSPKYQQNTSLRENAKKWTMIFFVLCNESGFSESPLDYSIDPYIGCYYRSSPFMEFKKDDCEKWNLEFLDSQLITKFNSFIKDEICVFKLLDEQGLEKVYLLNLDYERNNTVLKYYITTPEDRKSISADPKVFSKELPPLNSRPNFDLSQREKLISRFDGWILMS